MPQHMLLYILNHRSPTIFFVSYISGDNGECAVQKKILNERSIIKAYILIGIRNHPSKPISLLL